MLNDNVTRETLIYAYKINNEWQHLEDRYTTLLIKWLAKKTNIHNKGFQLNCIGSYLLRVEEAMDLKLNGIDIVLIKNTGTGQVIHLSLICMNR